MSSTIDVRDKARPIAYATALPFEPLPAIIKYPPNIRAKIAESINLIDFIVNSSVSVANATRSVFSCGMSSVFPSVSVCIYRPSVFVYIISYILPIVNTF